MSRTRLHSNFLFLLPSLALYIFLYPDLALAQITFTPPALLNSNGTTDVGQDNAPQFATDGIGNWIVVWESTEDLGGTAGIELDIFISRSMDNGATWTATALLNTNGTTDSGHDVQPKIAADGIGNWVAVWHSGEDLGGTAGTEFDIFVSRSTDAGATWTPPALLNTTGTIDNFAALDMNPDISTDGAGNWISIWHSSHNLGGTADVDWDILVARSTDAGATWTSPALLNTNGTTDTGEDRYAEIVTDGTGNWVAVWVSREDLGGTAGTDRDIFVAHSINAGATWTAPALLNTNGTTDTGEDYFPYIETDGSGNWITAWYSDENLGGTAGTDFDAFLSRSTDAGATWTTPSLLNTNGTTDTGDDFVPYIETDGSGNWIAAWYSDENLGGTAGTDEDIFVSHSTDVGITWTPPALLNTTGTTDTRDDYRPRIATNFVGDWVVVWESQDDFGGTVGTDPDMFSSTATLAPLVGLPAAGGWVQGLLALAILGIGWLCLRRSHRHL